MALAFESLQEASDLEGGARHKRASFIHGTCMEYAHVPGMWTSFGTQQRASSL